MITGGCDYPRRYLNVLVNVVVYSDNSNINSAIIFIARKIQHSHCQSIFIRFLPTRALALLVTEQEDEDTTKVAV